MGDTGTAPGDAVHVLHGERVAVRQHGATGEQAEPVQDRGVGAAEPVAHMVVRPVAFRAMGLHRAALLAHQRAQPVQQRVGAGGDEARGDDRLHQPVIAGQRADPRDQRTCAGERGHRILVAVEIRTELRQVHRHPADHRPLPACQAEFRQMQCRRTVQGGEIDRRGGAPGQQVADQGGVGAVREIEVGVARLERKGVALQPVLQRQVERLAELATLRRMHVQIDQAGQQIAVETQQRAGAIGGGAGVVVSRLAGQAHGGDDTVPADIDQRVAKPARRAGRRRVERVAEQRAATQIGRQNSAI